MIKLHVEYMDSYDDNGVPQEIGCSDIDVTDVLDAMSIKSIIGEGTANDVTAVLESQNYEYGDAEKRAEISGIYSDAIDGQGEYEYGISPALIGVLRFLDMLPLTIYDMYIESPCALSEYLADRTFAGALEPSTEKVDVLRRRVDRQFADLVKNLANEYDAVSGMLG